MKFVLDTHCHTVASGHAYSTVTELAIQAAHIGFELIAMTDHGPKMPGGAHPFHFMNLKALPKKIYGVEILKGAEVNIMDQNGTIDLEEEILKGLDIVIASLHPPCIAFGTVEENTRAVINAMKNPYIHIIGHPDDSRYPLNYKEVVAAAKEYKVLLEINNSSLKPGSYRAGAKENDRMLLQECKKQGAPVTIGSDAHFFEDIGIFSIAEELLKESEMPEQQIANTSVERLKSYLQKE